jgi:hypothetical protein
MQRFLDISPLIWCSSMVSADFPEEAACCYQWYLHSLFSFSLFAVKETPIGARAPRDIVVGLWWRQFPRARSQFADMGGKNNEMEL